MHGVSILVAILVTVLVGFDQGGVSGSRLEEGAVDERV